MPYSYPNNLPDVVKNKSEKAKKAFVEAFNSADRRGLTEDESFQAGLSAMKNAEKTHTKSVKAAIEQLKPRIPIHDQPCSKKLP